MKVLKVKEIYGLEILKEYGFEEVNCYSYKIYKYVVHKRLEEEMDILVNTVQHDDRIVRFFYYNDLDELVDERTGEINPVDYDIPVPGVLLDLIGDGILEVVEV